MTLSLTLLGTPEIYLDDHLALRFRTHKAQALLIYLAVTNRSWTRDALATLFWPETDDATARKNLRDILPPLRRQLGDYLLIDEETIGLKLAGPLQCDVTHFQMLMEGQLQSLDIERLAETLKLYRGEFLEGYNGARISADFELWVLREREHVHQLALVGFTTLCRRQREAGAYGAALLTNRRLLELAPWDEASHRRQMQLLAQTGQEAAALAQFDACRTILAEELSVEPLPETVALYEEIRAGAFRTVRELGPLSRETAATNSTATTDVDVTTLHTAQNRILPNNLPAPLATFIGRHAELALIADRLTATNCRLLTILGPGGMGKSSLALAAGQQLLTAAQDIFPDGIFWVPLTELSAPLQHGTVQGISGTPAPTDDMTGEAILRTVAEQIGCLLKPGVAPSVQLQSYLRTRHLLLILDNFEHLVGGVDAFVAVLTQTPGLKALVTSRIRLNVRGETVLSLKKLSLPTATYLADVAAQTNAADMMQDAMWQVSEAVAMFVQRIQQSDPFFTVNAENLVPIEQICQLVDGLPLGIELATSMLPLISCAQLAEELAKNLDFLVTDMRDLPKDQRSLGAVFERSWRLLSAEGQALLAKLSIFPGSFQRTAAEQIAGASLVLLGRLLDQSLLMKADDDRYILHHTIHSFAGQKLTQGLSQRTKLQEQFVQFYLDILARQERALSGDVYAPALAHIQADLDNIRTAWHWCIDQENLAVLGRSLDGLREFYQITGNYAEVIQLLEAALPVVRRAAETPATSAATDATPTGTPVESQNKQRLLGRLLCTLARFYRLYPRLGQVNKGERLAQEALALGRRLIDPEVQGLAYHELARLAQARRDYAAMRQLAEQGYVHGRQANMPQLTAESLNDLGVASGISAHPRAALPYLCEALTYLQRQPKRTLEVRVLGNLEYFHLVSHDYQAALDYMQRTHELRRQLPFRESSLLMLIHFGDLWRALGEYDAACAEYKQGLSLIATQRAPYWECWFYTSYGRLQHLRGDPAAAVDAYRHAHQIAQKDDIHTVDHFTQINWGHALADLGDPVAAAACYERAIAHQIAVNSILRTPDAHAGLAALALARNAVADAVTHTEAVLALLAEHDLDIAGEPFLIYSTCVRVLQAADDPRAQTVLAIAYRRLQEIAHALKEEHLRRSFLEHVVANRKLVDAACAAGLDR